MRSIVASVMYVYISTLVTSLNLSGFFINIINCIVITATFIMRITNPIILRRYTRRRLVTISTSVNIRINKIIEDIGYSSPIEKKKEVQIAKQQEIKK